MNRFKALTESLLESYQAAVRFVVYSLSVVRGLVVFSGYDSDVAREKVVDYVTKIYSAAIRNMSGTRPHLQHKELPVEERYHKLTATSAEVQIVPDVV